MHEKSDAHLLRDHAERRDEAAFREIVTRYTNLVYSAALRQVESSGAAADIAQSVFTDLARKARSLAEKLPDNGSLAGWLHRSTRFVALNHLRDTRRRLHHERQAMEQLLTDSESSADWEQIRPALDEALDSLCDEDREALLLRYFKNQDLRSVGAGLGVSEDAAQKRVSRAVERLREFFSKRGVTVGASGLVVVISANAVQAAPAGLAITISTVAALAGTAVSTSTAIALTKAIAMTTLQKTIIGATLAAAVGTGIYEARQASTLRSQTRLLQQQQAPLAEQIRQLTSERDEATRQNVALRRENELLKSNTFEIHKLRSEMSMLREKLRAASRGGVPEQSVATTNSLDQILKILWDDDPSSTGDDRRYKAAAQLRNLGPQAVQGLPIFRQLLHSGNQETSYAGARALAFTSEACPESFQYLSNALSDPDPQVRDAATHGVDILFGDEFKDVDSTLPTLLRNLRDIDQTVRADTAGALREYVERKKQFGKGAEPELVIPALMQNLNDEWRYARLNAVQCLQEYGDAAKAAIPQLRNLLQDPEPMVRAAAQGALEQISKVDSKSK